MAFQQIEMFVNSINHRINAIYFKTSLFKESILNLDFLHSQIYYTIDKMMIPAIIKTQFKNLFVSFFLY